MIKNKEVKPSGNGTMEALLAAFNQFRQDVNDRFEDLEKKGDVSGAAKLYIAERMFNPDRKHLAEMTNNPLKSITIRADAATAGSFLDDDVQKCEVSPGQKWQETPEASFPSGQRKWKSGRIPRNPVHPCLP